MIKNALSVPQNDIFNLNENSEEWTKLKKNYERIVKIILIFLDCSLSLHHPKKTEKFIRPACPIKCCSIIRTQV